eukprot:TRINITY_DN10126_c0_g1_i15.p1 TRINITY_DN10126_c0_g1~~TRINITY_DN10126_c0_g1_i15.p1  ORF type:complete len:105 (-),score=12.51 TRINITY_DN10126_c0_g1_i15:53-346(-)
MIRRPPRSTPLYSSAASDVYKRQPTFNLVTCEKANTIDQPYLIVNLITLKCNWRIIKKASPQPSTIFSRRFFPATSPVLFFIHCRTCLLYTSPSPRD